MLGLYFVLLFQILSLANELGQKPESWVCTVEELKQYIESASGGQYTCTVLIAGSYEPHQSAPSPAMIENLKKADLVLSVGTGSDEPWLKNAFNLSGTKVVWQGSQHIRVGELLKPMKIEKSKTTSSNPFEEAVILLSPKRWHTFFELLPDIIKSRRIISGSDEPLCVHCKENSLKQRELLSSKIREWFDRLAQKGPKKVISYHGSFGYFLADFGVHDMGKMEIQHGENVTGPGILKLSKSIRDKNADTMIFESTAPTSLIEKIRSLNPEVRIVILPVGLGREAKSLIALFELYVARLTAPDNRGGP